MTVVGICTVRDAVDIIGPVVRHMIAQVDHVIVADNLSTDGTYDILDDLDIELVNDPDPAHRQSQKMTGLADLAAMIYGADWIVPFDADEIWYSPFGRLADRLEQQPPDVHVVSAELYDHVPSAGDDDAITDPVSRITWRRSTPGALPKVACRWRPDLTIDDGNHGASYRLGQVGTAAELVVRHYPYRSPEQFVRKARTGAAALRQTDLDESIGLHWRRYADIAEAHGDDACAGIFLEHFWSPDPVADALVYDPAWAAVEAACRSL